MHRPINWHQILLSWLVQENKNTIFKSLSSENHQGHLQLPYNMKETCLLAIKKQEVAGNTARVSISATVLGRSSSGAVSSSRIISRVVVEMWRRARGAVARWGVTAENGVRGWGARFWWSGRKTETVFWVSAIFYQWVLCSLCWTKELGLRSVNFLLCFGCCWLGRWIPLCLYRSCMDHIILNYSLRNWIKNVFAFNKTELDIYVQCKGQAKRTAVTSCY